MNATFKISQHKTGYGLVLFLCAALLVGGAAFAQDGHDHGNTKDAVSNKDPVAVHDHANAKDTTSAIDLANVHHHGGGTQGQVISETPIREGALPEGLS